VCLDEIILTLNRSLLLNRTSSLNERVGLRRDNFSLLVTKALYYSIEGKQ